MRLAGRPFDCGGGMYPGWPSPKVSLRWWRPAQLVKAVLSASRLLTAFGLADKFMDRREGGVLREGSLRAGHPFEPPVVIGPNHRRRL